MPNNSFRARRRIGASRAERNNPRAGRSPRTDASTPRRSRSPARAIAATAKRPDASVRIATYNVTGVNGRLPNLLAWLECLQELKAPDEKFPAEAIRAAGYGAIWHGQKSWNGVAILARGAAPTEIRRGLPGDPDDTHSRYIEATIDGMVVGCLYLPNGNPAPGPKFDYKLRWFERFAGHAKSACWRAARRSCSLATTT